MFGNIAKVSFFTSHYAITNHLFLEENEWFYIEKSPEELLTFPHFFKRRFTVYLIGNGIDGLVLYTFQPGKFKL